MLQSGQQWYHDGAGPSSAAPNRLPTSQANVTRRPEEASEKINEAYFDSYGFFGIHRDMLSDKVPAVSVDASADAITGKSCPSECTQLDAARSEPAWFELRIDICCAAFTSAQIRCSGFWSCTYLSVLSH